jgi:hypothetical protein
MLFEYRRAWQALEPGGLLLSDDAFETPAFWWFAWRRRLPVVHIGNLALTCKPGAAVASEEGAVVEPERTPVAV